MEKSEEEVRKVIARLSANLISLALNIDKEESRVIERMFSAKTQQEASEIAKKALDITIERNKKEMEKDQKEIQELFEERIRDIKEIQELYEEKLREIETKKEELISYQKVSKESFERLIRSLQEERWKN